MPDSDSNTSSGGRVPPPSQPGAESRSAAGTGTDHSHAGPLDGVNVLDFSHALAGPYCTLLMADYGANVYKVEARDGGDMGRTWGPPFVGNQASYFLGLHRGKYGVSIDLKQPRGIELCLRLIEKMDVLIENFRPGTMERLGLGYAAARNRNPRLIYCSISGYGQSGPCRDDPAMDLIVQSSSGLLSVTGTETGNEPVRCGYSVADVNAGMFAMMGILMALLARDRTGEGQLVDISMQDGMISAMTSSLMIFLGGGGLPRPMGTGYQTIVPYRVFRAKDRDLALAVASDKLWSAFCKAIDRPEWERHPDYATNQLRVKNREVLEGLLADMFRQRPVGEWLKILGDGGVPCSLVRNFGEVVDDPHNAHREMFPVVDHPVIGPHRATGMPVKFSDTPGHFSTAAPLIGEHTRRSLTSLLGLDAAAIRDLESSGVVFQSPDA